MLLANIYEQHHRACSQVGFGTWTGLHHRNFTALNDGVVIQFGVSIGKTLAQLVRIYRRETWGFDTFTGLPNEARGEATMNGWKPGSFNAGGTKQISAIKQKAGGEVKLIPGLFKDILTEDLARQVRQAIYIDIDSDLYISAWEALDWVFKHRIAAPGTVIGYDDTWVLPCVANDTRVELYGEAKAHLQISRKYQVAFQCICGPCVPHEQGKPYGWRTYFAVTSVGDHINTGMLLQGSAAQEYLAHSGICRGARNNNRIKWNQHVFKSSVV